MEYGGLDTLRKFQADREAQIKANSKKKGAPVKPKIAPYIELKRAEERLHEYQEAIKAKLFAEPPPITYDLSSLKEAKPPLASDAEVSRESRSRVRSLKTLAVRAFAENVLLYEELSDFPAALKAPVYIHLMKELQLTAPHLKVLLSTDQKRLDLSRAACTSSFISPSKCIFI